MDLSSSTDSSPSISRQTFKHFALLVVDTTKTQNKANTVFHLGEYYSKYGDIDIEEYQEKEFYGRINNLSDLTIACLKVAGKHRSPTLSRSVQSDSQIENTDPPHNCEGWRCDIRDSLSQNGKYDVYGISVYSDYQTSISRSKT